MSYQSRYEYQDSLSMDTGGESEHDMRLRKAKNELLDSWDEFADSPANNYREWRGKEAEFSWRGAAWGFALTLAMGLLCWICWQGYHVVKFLAGW